MPRGFRYSRWDGTQTGFDFGADEVLSELTEDLLYHGDLEAALRRLRQRRLQELGGNDLSFSRLAEAMSGFGDEERERLTSMLGALNRMLDERAAGGDPDFAGFMREFGDFFPGDPADLDEFLDQLAAQMAATRAVLESMSPEERAQLDELAAQLAADVDLQWQLDQLGHHLSGRAGDPGPMAADGLGLLGAARFTERLSQLDQLAELARLLEEAGLIEQREGRAELTPRGLRHLGQNALADLFGRLARDRLGRHELAREGPGQERSYDTKPYEYGDPFNLSIERTVRNAVRREGRGLPVALSPDDFEVERTETLTRSSTVLMLDLSLSMPMRDNFLAAKKVAMALHSLISTQFPTDFLGVIGFSEVARAVRPERLPEVSWDFVFGTNMQHALLLARRMLAGKPGSRQIVMITDGEPTAHLLPDGSVFFHYPSTRATVDATLAEVARCTREGIRINTFMLDASSHLKAFVERMSRLNRGRAFFTTPDSLGDFVLVDFLEQKRAYRRGA